MLKYPARIRGIWLFAQCTSRQGPNASHSWFLTGPRYAGSRAAVAPGGWHHEILLAPQLLYMTALDAPHETSRHALRYFLPKYFLDTPHEALTLEFCWSAAGAQVPL